MLTSKDKSSRVEQPSWLIRGFREVVLDCNLSDLPLIGYPYTWEKSKDSPNAVEERLDRALGFNSWLVIFSHARLSNLSAPIFFTTLQSY